MSRIVYGPQGSGKTINAAAMARLLQITGAIVDDSRWPTSKKEVEAFKAGDDLWLVNDDSVPPFVSRKAGGQFRRVISMAEMAEMLKADGSYRDPTPGVAEDPPGPEFSVPGYELLAGVLSEAYNQAARGKGAERHARDAEPFHEQVILEGARRFGTGSLLFQAFKKSEESQRLPRDAAVKELLGAVVYLSAAVIHMKEKAE